MIKFIFYSSKASFDLSKEELNALISEARYNNNKNQVTGILLYMNNTFLQYIEGPEKNIDTLYNKILKDDRHHSLSILESGLKPIRQYEDWTMLFKKVSSQESDQLLQSLKTSEKDVSFDNLNLEDVKMFFDQFGI